MKTPTSPPPRPDPRSRASRAMLRAPHPLPLAGDVETDVLVVGAGLAGLVAATTAARSGARTTLLDAREDIGGRARSEEVDGFNVNEGAHALYRAGAGRTVLRDLGIRPRGRIPTQRGGAWLLDDERVPWRRTSAVGGTVPALSVFRSLMSARAALGTEGRSVADWMAEHIPDEGRPLAEMLLRTTTYSTDMASLDAAAVLAQVRLGGRGVLYLHGGWQSIVSALEGAAVAAGVDLRTGRVSRVEDGPDEVVTTTSEGLRVKAGSVVLAAGGPGHADSILDGSSATVAGWAEHARPVRATCLDIALRTVPRPRQRSTYALDQPLYLVDHAATARVAPDGGGVFHGLWYEPDLVPEVDPTARLERAMDITQPGWREHVVTQRRRRQIVVAHDRPRPGVPASRRPTVEVDDLEAVYVAGDWIGGHGMLADAAIGSGHEAGRAAAGRARRGRSSTRTATVCRRPIVDPRPLAAP